MTLVFVINTLFSVLTIVALGLSLVLAIAFFSDKVRGTPLVSFFAHRSVLIGFVVALTATLGSLTYSDVIGYAPCVLCWFQRIFMYPQVLIMGIALYRSDWSVRTYGFVLSVVGGALAFWHYLGQLGIGSLPCSAVGYSVSCAERFVMQYGFITIPMMALAAFMLMALSHALALRSHRPSPLVRS